MSPIMPTPVNKPRLINSFYTRVVYPLLQSSSYRGLPRLLKQNGERERLSLEENRRQQWDSLLHLLQHAYDSTPFYRRRFEEAGLQPRDIASPADLRKLPPLTRDDLRLHQDELWSRRYQRNDLLSAATGGTTDTPIPLLRAPEAIPRKAAVHSRFNSWAGMWPGDKVFYLWGARVDYPENPSWRWRLYDRYLMRRIWAPTSMFNEQVLESYRQTLNRFRPRILYGYPTPIALFCEFLRDSGRPFHRPASVISTAEPLLPQHRQVIEQTLGCSVYELYGSREFGMIAAECECHQGLHLNPSAAYLELLPVEGAELDGLHEVLVTDLLNEGMPLIRYKINDCTRVGPEECPCGRGYPLIQQITGRTMDNFYLPNGDVVPGISLQNRVIKVCPGVKKIQVIQDTLSEFRVRFVPGDSFSPDDLKPLQHKLDEYFGNSVRWRFEKVDDIERERSGKTRFCISHVPRPLPSSRTGPNAETR